MLKRLIAVTKFFVPGDSQIYPPWQGMQYMHNMYLGRCKLTELDNVRYPVNFTGVRELLAEHLSGKLTSGALPG